MLLTFVIIINIICQYAQRFKVTVDTIIWQIHKTKGKYVLLGYDNNTMIKKSCGFSPLGELVKARKSKDLQLARVLIMYLWKFQRLNTAFKLPMQYAFIWTSAHHPTSSESSPLIILSPLTGSTSSVTTVSCYNYWGVWAAPWSKNCCTTDK